MAQQLLGDSCTAHRNCHSEARISGQVLAEHGGSSKRNPMIKSLHLLIRKRQSSYSQRAWSRPEGGVAITVADSRFMGMV
jgi:hypothetical protein